LGDGGALGSGAGATAPISPKSGKLTFFLFWPTFCGYDLSCFSLLEIGLSWVPEKAFIA